MEFFFVCLGIILNMLIQGKYRIFYYQNELNVKAEKTYQQFISHILLPLLMYILILHNL